MVLVGRDQEREEIERALRERRDRATSARLALVGEPGIGKTALLDHAAQPAAGMQRAARTRDRVRGADPVRGRCSSCCGRRWRCSRRSREPQAIALEGALALRPRSGAGAVRGRCGDAQPARRLRRAGPVAVLIDDAHWLDGSSAQALLFAFRRLVADPIAVLIAVREGEPSLLDGADLPTLRVGWADQRRGGACCAASAPRRCSDCTEPPPATRSRCSNSPTRRSDLALAPEGAPLLVSARISGAFLRRVARLDDAARRALVLAATSDSGDLPMLERAARGSGSISRRSRSPRAPGWSRWRRDRSSSATRWPGRRSTRTAPRGSVAPRTARWPPRSPTETSIAAPGIWPPLPSGLDDAASAALEQAGAGRATAAPTRPRPARVRARRPADGRQRTSRATAAGRPPRPDGWPAWPTAPWRCSRRPARRPRDAAADRDRSARRPDRDSPRSGDARVTRSSRPPRRAPIRSGRSRCSPRPRSRASTPGTPAEMLSVAERASAQLPIERLSPRALPGGDRGRDGADRRRRRRRRRGGDPRGDRARRTARPSCSDDLELLPWLALGPIFLREAGAGALAARARARDRAGACRGRRAAVRAEPDRP